MCTFPSKLRVTVPVGTQSNARLRMGNPVCDRNADLTRAPINDAQLAAPLPVHVWLRIVALKKENRDAHLIVEIDALTRGVRVPQLTRVEASSSNLISKARPGLGCRGVTGRCRAEGDIPRRTCPC